MRRQYIPNLILIILSLLLSSTNSSTTVSAPQHLNNLTDQNALLALKDRIHDPYDILRQNWTTKTSFCTWLGVSCAVGHKRVAALNLADMNLVGTLAPEIGNLSFLRLLNISNNRFHGSLPDELGRLRRMKIMIMYSNHLGGPIPFNLTNCVKLQVLSLSYNNFVGRIPDQLQKLTMLQELYLGSNTLTGTIPEGLGHLPNLQKLNLCNNTLRGAIPLKIFNSSNLEFLDLNMNDLSGHLSPTLGLSLPKLQFLHLAGNQLTGVIPASISNASRLKEIELCYNKFAGSVPRTLGNLRELELLTLQSNYLTNEPSSSTTTTTLDFLTSLTNCRHLKILTMENNAFNGGELPNTVGNLSITLQTFSASFSGIKGRIPEEIGNLTNLLTLLLSGNELTGAIPKSIGNLSKLQKLHLQHNQLDGSIPTALCLLTKMGSLDVEANKLTGTIPHCLGNMTSLREILLSSNQLTSTIPATLGNVKNLVNLNLSLNRLTGPLPVEIGGLNLVVLLDLSNNQLSGQIPSSINGLQMLVNLTLSNNRFHGALPAASIGELESLKTLDLSQNSLSGTIPKELETLSDLTYLNLSFNSFQGEIPTGGPFVKFTAESFLGNAGLCSRTPRLQLPACPNKHSRKRATILIIVMPAAAAAASLVLALIMFHIRRTRKIKKSDDAPGPNVSLINTIALRRFSQHEIIVATNQLSGDNLLGTGTFGSVYKAVFSDELVAAVKVFATHLQEEAFHSFDAECEVLKSIRHRNLVKVISSCSNLEFQALVLEYMPNGNLDKWLHSDNNSGHGHLDLLQRLNTMIDVASAVEYLHHGCTTPVVHRDLKPTNVLLDQDMVAHVGDFGLAKLLDEGQSTILSNNLATIGYMAPEYGSGGIVSTKSDVYSYGIMLMETFTGKRPTDLIFQGDINLKHWVHRSLINLREIIDVELLGIDEEHFHQAEEQCVDSLMELALNCTSETPQERITMIEVVASLNKIKTELVPKPRQSARDESMY